MPGRIGHFMGRVPGRIGYLVRHVPGRVGHFMGRVPGRVGYLVRFVPGRVGCFLAERLVGSVLRAQGAGGNGQQKEESWN